jgi:hypothetical protein
MQFKIQKHNLIHFTGSRDGLVKICLKGGIGVMLIANLNITLIIIIIKCSIFLKIIIEE